MEIAKDVTREARKLLKGLLDGKVSEREYSLAMPGFKALHEMIHRDRQLDVQVGEGDPMTGFMVQVISRGGPPRQSEGGRSSVDGVSGPPVSADPSKASPDASESIQAKAYKQASKDPVDPKRITRVAR